MEGIEVVCIRGLYKESQRLTKPVTSLLCWFVGALLNNFGYFLDRPGMFKAGYVPVYRVEFTWKGYKQF
jgi:hypothetical protein